jgi:hypothetical protein
MRLTTPNPALVQAGIDPGKTRALRVKHPRELLHQGHAAGQGLCSRAGAAILAVGEHIYRSAKVTVRDRPIHGRARHHQREGLAGQVPHPLAELGLTELADRAVLGVEDRLWR